MTRNVQINPENLELQKGMFSLRELKTALRNNISQTTDSHFANYRFSFRKLQIPISQTTDSHFANYRFSFRKLQISISQTTDFHFANYRFPFPFVPFRFANYSKPNQPIKKLSQATKMLIVARRCLYSLKFVR